MNKVSFGNVKLGGFWKDRFELNKSATIPTIFDRFTDTGRFKAFKCKWKEGDDLKPHFFWDSDIAKWIEAAAYTIRINPDKNLEKIIDEVVDDIEENMEDDGYFNIYYTVVEPGRRFTNRDHHELYCLGHLTEAAIAYDEATGKDKFLKLMCRYIDLVIKLFVQEDSVPFSTPGHEEIELALIKLYEYTGEEKYLSLCKHFIDLRGVSKKDDMPTNWAADVYYQSNMPVRDFTYAEGHSVRAVYLYSGMADLAEKTGDKELLDACKRVFDNICLKQMYITGGIGATECGESFTEDYVLPNDLAYSETCASIGLAFFARRMSRICPDSKYADVAELAIYNCALAGVSLDGRSFFYVNPLEINLNRHRVNKAYYRRNDNLLTQRIEVFDCSCCPPNLARFVASIGDFLYNYDESTVYVHHYMESEAEFDGIKIRQQTRYPLEGGVRTTISGMAGRCLAFRIPGWCGYVSLNGEKLSAEVKNGYAYIDITDDEQVLDIWFEMKAELIGANPAVEYDLDRVCLCRGPLVYCAESVLNDGVKLNNISIETDLEAGFEFDDKSGAYIATVKAYEDIMSDSLYKKYADFDTKVRYIRMLPYFAFANNGESDMLIWFRTKHKEKEQTND